MCGRDVVAWASFAALLREFDECFGHTELLVNPILPCAHWHSIMSISLCHPGFQTLKDIRDKRSDSVGLGPNLDLYQILEATCGRGCLDLRDRVFGVMKLVQWPPDVDAIEVNYQQATFQVAIDVLHHYSPQSGNAVKSAVTLAKSLQIDPGDNTLDREHVQALSTAPFLTTTVVMKHTTCLRQSTDGLLQGDFAFTNTKSQYKLPLPPKDLRNAILGLFNKWNERVGLIGAQCRSGDVMMELADGMHVVVRPHLESGERSFRIIGHAILLSNYQVQRHFEDRWPGEKLGEQAACEIHLHAYDLLPWACNQLRFGVGKLSMAYLRHYLSAVRYLAKPTFGAYVFCVAHPVSLMRLSRRMITRAHRLWIDTGMEGDLLEQRYERYLRRALRAGEEWFLSLEMFRLLESAFVRNGIANKCL